MSEQAILARHNAFSAAGAAALLVRAYRAHPFTVTLVTGLALSAVTIALTICLASVLKVLLSAEHQRAASAPIAEASPGFALVAALFYAPLWETLFCQALPIAAARVLSLPWKWQIALSAAVFGSAHWLFGSIGHGLITFTGGLLLAGAYVVAREQGRMAAYGTVFVAHMSHNALAAFVVPVWFSKLA